MGIVQIDAGVKPEGMAVETHSGRDYLGFAGVENPVIKTASREYMVADKLTLMLSETHNRPRDYVHASLLLNENLESKALFQHMRELAQIRGVEKKLTGHIEPTERVARQISVVCETNNLNLDVNECLKRVNNVMDRFNGREKSQFRGIDLPDSRGPEPPKQRSGPARLPTPKELSQSRNAPEKADARSESPRSNVIRQPSAREIVDYSRTELPKVSVDRQIGVDKTPGIIKTPGLDRGTGIEKANPGADRGINPTAGTERSSGPGRGYGGPTPGRDGGFNAGGGER